MLKILQRIIQEVAGASDFKEALDIMVKRVSKALRSQSCSVFLFDRRSGDYILTATNGLNPKAVGSVRIPSGQGLIGLVGEREEPVNLDDASQHPRFLSIPLAQEEAYKAFLGVPLIYHRQVLGVIMVQQQEIRRYDEAEEAFLVTLAAQLSATIAHAEATGAVDKLLNIQNEKKGEATYSGIPSSPGVAIGVGVVVYPLLDLEVIPDREPEDIEEEISLLKLALTAGQEDFRIMSERLYPILPPEERILFDVYQRILDSSDLGVEIIEAIRAGNWAQGALRSVIQKHIQTLENLENEYLRERAVDIKELGNRVLAYLQKNNRSLPEYSENTILIGEELTAVDLAEVPQGCLVGVISAKGSSSSHIAILARAMGVPTIMGANEIPTYDLQGKDIILDAYYGQIYVAPTQALRDQFEHLAEEERQLSVLFDSIRHQPAQLQDGVPVTLMVNTGLGADVSLSLAAGAQGVGLYRTETPFLMRDRFPSGEEQRVIYRQLLMSFSPRPVTMRTLDVGGDKALPYFPVKEDNPFLGWRGIRITLDHPEIFLTQVRAMMRASEGYNNLRIMLPMITDVSEVDDALRLLKKAYKEVCETHPDIKMPSVGVMVEVPSAVYQARQLARRVDFLSVGSNDLTQYLLAVDRNNARVAGLFDCMHPAVLRALLQVIEGGHQEGKHVNICGEIAGDPCAVPLLVAMGFDSLSMSAPSLGRTKWVLQKFAMQEAMQLLNEVLNMESAVMIRCHMELALERAGLGGLVRAGKR